MVKKRSIAKNYVFNLIYEVFSIIMPLIVTPYIARVLGEDGSGKFSYTYSIAHMFALFAALGFTKYAQRLVAQHQGDKYQQSVDFWEVMIARLVPSFFALGAFIILTFSGFLDTKYTILLLLQSFYIVSVIFDISFFFQGNEEFGKIVGRNLLIKLLTIISIFVFVKTENDVAVYIAIQSGSHLLSCVILGVYLPQYLVKVKKEDIHPFKHLPASAMLFLPTIAISVYTVLDKTLLGLITKIDAENGNYDYAEKIIKVCMTVITSLGAVVIPRNSMLFAKGEYEKVKENLRHSSRFVFFLGIPLVLGWVAISDIFVPWFLGDGYNKVSLLIKILAPLIMIVGFSNLLGIQYLLPSKQDKKYTIAISCGALINLVLNIPLIYLLQSYGAALATLCAELTVTVMMFIFARKELSFFKLIKLSKEYIIAGIIMFVPIIIMGRFLSPGLLSVMLTIAAGIIIYFSTLVIEKEFFVNKGIEILKAKLKKIKKNRNKTEEG